MLAQDDDAPHESPLADEPEGGAMPLAMAADLQDHLMVASNDLERLQRLLDDAGQTLLMHSYGATGQLKHLLDAAAAPAEIGHAPLQDVMQHMSGAITAMQFQDLATQLIAHTRKRLRNCADRIARDTMADDEDGSALVEAAPLRPNPVTQDEMEAGSIELF